MNSSLRIGRRLKTALRALLIDTPLLPGPPADAAAFRKEDKTSDMRPGTPCPAAAILACAACPVCGDEQRTLVNEFNKLVLLDWLPDEDVARYDYSLCHACGILYAARRPTGPRYRWLFEHFELALGRGAKDDVGNLLASTPALSDAEREELQRRAAHGVFVSDHLRVSRKQYLPMLLADRLSISAHAEILGSLLELGNARVLEIRSRVGSLGAILRRLYGADVSTMAFFERQRFVIEHVYGLAAKSLVDFDEFTIPYDGQFDLIVTNHMLTHAVRPREFLATIRDRLRPGGHLYLYHEPDDAEYLSADGQSMINRLNPFHLQAFDGASLVRGLAANGFEALFLSRYEGEFLCLCRVDGLRGDWPHMTAKERDRRIRDHLRARDAAALMAPPHVRNRFAAEWDGIIDRAFAAGIAEVGANGQVRARRRMHKRSQADAEAREP